MPGFLHRALLQAGVALQLELGEDCEALLEAALEPSAAAEDADGGGGSGSGGGGSDRAPSPSTVPRPPSPITAPIIAGLFRCLRRVALKAEGAIEVAAGISPQHVTLMWYLVARTGASWLRAAGRPACAIPDQRVH